MNLKKWVLVLGSSHIFFYSLVWLLVLLVVGTIDQKNIGLYAAQEKYFSAWTTFLGPIPTPGGRFVMSLMSLNLICVMSDFATWSWKKSGILIAHFGSLLLLVGGLLTALTSVEGSMSIKEGATGSEFQDYHELELLLIDHSPADHDSILAFYGKTFDAGQALVNPALSDSITVDKFFLNSEIVPRATPTAGTGMLSRFELQEREAEKEATSNLSGMVITQHAKGEPAQSFIVQEAMSVAPSLQIQGKTYEMVLQRRRYRLPFQIKCVDFVKEVYPGTDTPKSYHSDVLLIDNNAPREVRIQMNEPLRHRGYTFFQSSFMQSRTGETTVLTVVKNYGRDFPYISSLVICFGLLIHMVLRLPARLKRTVAMEKGGLK